MKTKPLGTTDRQFRLAMSLLALMVVGIICCAIWIPLTYLVPIGWNTWYYPCGFALMAAACTYFAPEKTMGFLGDLLKGLTSQEDP